METGSNISASLIKKEYDLLPDNQQELAEEGHKSFVDISRSGVQIVRLNSSFKTVTFRSFVFPNSLDDGRWTELVGLVFDQSDFKSALGNSQAFYSIHDHKTTLIPNALFSTDSASQNFEFLNGQSPTFTIKDVLVDELDAVGVFAIPNAMEKLAGQPLSNSFFHWINTLGTTGTTAHLLISGNQFGLVILKGKDLQFCNWFAVKNADDILYFLMAALESLNILHSEVSMTLWGEVDKNDEVHFVISKFISNIGFGNRPKNLEYAYSFKDLPTHRFPFIFSTACA